MSKKEEIFKTIILFLFFLFGCSNKYADVEGEPFEGEVVSSWQELDCKIVEQDEQGFSLGVQIESLVVIGDSLGLEARSEGDKGFLPVLGGIVMYVGGLGGCFYATSQDFDFFPTEERMEKGCLISGISFFAGLVMSYAGGARGYVVDKAVPDFIKTDTICVDSMILSKQKIKISVEESDFEKSYYTDEDGNIDLKLNEIIPKPSVADSVLNLIIQYEEMVDSVDVKIK